jgi:hypothetical protein
VGRTESEDPNTQLEMEMDERAARDRDVEMVD